jgi:RimJ/RimL family protein N-acetyltransferase
VALHDTGGRSEHVPAKNIDWRTGLRELRDNGVTLRPLSAGDAPSLVAHLNDPRVLRYITPCPTTEAGFRRFIRWTHSQRRLGSFVCYGIVPRSARHAVGIIQVWPIERDFSTAEWGFALGASFWRTGTFHRAARLFLDEVFSQFGVYRLEARAVDANVPGNLALERLGAVRDGVLRGGFHDGAIVRDHVMWSILAPEWSAARAIARTAN